MRSFNAICDHGYVVVGTKDARFSISPEKICNGAVTVQIFDSRDEAMGDKGVYNSNSFCSHFDLVAIVEGDKIGVLDYDCYSVWSPQVTLDGCYHIYTSSMFPCVVFIRIDNAEEIE